VLEIRQAEGAFAAIEGYLRERGFFGGGADGVVADLYLGYGLSAAIRREPWPDPPEPCPLPLAACRVRPVDEPPRPTGAYRVGEWARSWDDERYAAAVVAVQDAIARGDVYQVNLVQHLAAPFTGDAAGLGPALAPLRPLGPRPLGGPGWTIVTATPELMAERDMAGVTHLVTTVEGTLREGVGLAELLAATFPGGSITGAPKIAAVDRIAQLAPVGRGASMGALGTVRPNGDLDLALTIRTFAVAEGRIHLWVGGGIVWDSDPQAEIEESWVKARPLLAAIGAPVPERVHS
jgi:anthranilate/para-aminobenzoate synthase component I